VAEQPLPIHPLKTEGALEVVSKPPLGPNLGVGREIQILEILEYSSGSNVAPALTLNPIEGFETTSMQDRFERYNCP
jgi:hypothetical protein